MTQKPVKNRPPVTLFLPGYFLTRPSFKDLNVAVLTKWSYMLKRINMRKVPSGGRAESENIEKRPYCDILNLSSATRGRIPNVNTLLASMATSSKKLHSDFLKTAWL